jgi:hypothetical protein
MRVKNTIAAIALALLLGGGLMVMAAVQGTDISETGGNNAIKGYRVGSTMDPSATRNPLRRAGIFTYPVVRQEFDAVSTGNTSSTVVNSWDFGTDSETTNTEGFTLATFPTPRAYNFWLEFTSDTNGTEAATMTVTVTGTDYYGISQTETTQINGATSASSGRYAGTKAFRTLTSVALTDTEYGTEYGATSMTLDIGLSTKLGLKYRIRENTILRELVDADGSGGAIPVIPASDEGTVAFGVANDAAVSATSADFRGTWIPDDVPDGTTDYVLYYIPTDIENLYYGD